MSEQCTVPAVVIDLDGELCGVNPALDRLVELLEQIQGDEDAQDALTAFVATSCNLWNELEQPELAAVVRQILIVMLNVINLKADSDG